MASRTPFERRCRSLLIGGVMVAAGCGDLLHSTNWATRCDSDPEDPECGAGGTARGPGGASSVAGGSGAGRGGGGGMGVTASGGGGDPMGSGGATAQSSASSGGGCVASPEVCNLLDDDCNGSCDESAGCKIGVHRSYHPLTGEHFYSADIGEAQCCGFVLEYANFFYLYGVALPGLDALYRCSLTSGKHLLTKSSDCEGGGSLDGSLGFSAAGAAPCGGDTPLYRLYLPSNGDHFYTVSSAEHDSAVASGYLDEGVSGYVWTSP